MRSFPIRPSRPLGALWCAALITGCRALFPQPSTDAVRRQQDAVAYLAHPIAVGQLVIHADFLLPTDHRLIAELVSERELIANRLALPPGDEPIHIHLFEDERSYRQVVAEKFPEFPERRAIFVESHEGLAIYAHWNESVAEDLRHEVAHGYLHSTVGELPLWLDEGLAEYFEVSRGRHGANQSHIDFLTGKLAVGSWQPSLDRLERLTAAADMTQLDYAEAWLWVHFMLESDRELSPLLAEYLAAEPTQPTTPLSAGLRARVPHAEAALVDHLKSFGK